MKGNIDHIDLLIGKYLAGEAADDEILFVESWAKENASNQKYIDQCKLIFNKAIEVAPLQEFDMDAAWESMKARLHSRDAKTVRFAEPKSIWYFAWRIAASVIVILGVGFVAYRLYSGGNPQPLEVIAENQTKADTLPDGSGVFLNKETELAYSYDKQKKNHVVKLKGEAYFNIHHDDNKAFVIDAEGVFIRDIGTSFNVKAYPEENTVEVVVEEGKVMFYTDKDSGIYLSANGKGIYNKTTKTFSIEQPEENVLAYKTRFFSFSNTDLRTAVEALNSVYDKKIVIGGNLNKCHLTVSFNNEDIDEIAAIMAETLGLTIQHAEDEIRLEGSGCEK